MKRFVWGDLSAAGRLAALERPKQRTDEKLRSAVQAIVDEVRRRGWRGVVDVAVRIDGEAPREIDVRPLAAEARRHLPADQVAAMEFAAGRIAAFHQGSLPSDFAMETAPGLTVRKTWRAIDRVGLYVPGGKTPLFSSLMMLAIPARAAGVREMVTVTPPRSDGGLDERIALAAELSGIGRIWTVGGAQAIAALAFGAGAIPKVDKVCGPGNAWVAEAKRLVSALPGGSAIDMPAGPSELMVIADESADTRLVAADLLSQAEHDAAAQVLLVTLTAALCDAVQAELEKRLSNIPRGKIAKASLGNARFIHVASLDEAIEVANLYAPEHLSLAIAASNEAIAKVRNAGAVFAGSLAAETFGDYLAGSSHVLPTDGAARAWGGVSVYTFLKA
ncbi:MAG TPA: histidinol dehydrogenase, partial [Sphingomicrobium sp.]|nr:histidinol dehydrogenase [Sphingomicrobium sp.]